MISEPNLGSCWSVICCYFPLDFGNILNFYYVFVSFITRFVIDFFLVFNFILEYSR